MSEPKPDAITSWVANWQLEDAATAAARRRAVEVGVSAVDPTAGALLRFLAAACGARTVVELGTGAGVSTMWLLRGMHPEGVLTSVDTDREHQRLARTSLTEAGIPASRVRLIGGRALEVLPRLSDGSYDLVFCDAAKVEYVDYLEAAMRLLRPGGLVVFGGVLAGGRVTESSARDADTVALRELLRVIREDASLVPALIPAGSGLLAVTTGGMLEDNDEA